MTSQDERVDQQGALTSSMEEARGDGAPPSQEEESPVDQDVADQSGVAMPEAEPEASTVQGQEMLQPGEIDTPPQEAAEPMVGLEEPADDDLPSRMPMEPPAQEPVVTAFEQSGTVDAEAVPASGGDGLS